MHMMKKEARQVLVISRGNQRYFDEMHDQGLATVSCGFDQNLIFKNKGASSAIIVILEDEKPEDVKKLAGMLQILCIDEEKNLFVYGKKDLVDIIKGMVPSLFIIYSGYLFKELFRETAVAAREFLKEIQENKKPILLLADDDSVYINRIKPLLDDDFVVYACKNKDPHDIAIRIRMCDVAVLSTSLRFSLIYFTDIFMEILKRKKNNPQFALYFIADQEEEQKNMNSLEERNFIALSKETEVQKTASFLIKRYANR